jgi:hypothetical protein
MPRKMAAFCALKGLEWTPEDTNRRSTTARITHSGRATKGVKFRRLRRVKPPRIGQWACSLPGYLIAVNPAVWHAPNKKLDVTPFNKEHMHRPLAGDGTVRFLIDNGAMSLRNERVGLALPSWFIPMTELNASSASTSGSSPRWRR